MPVEQPAGDGAAGARQRNLSFAAHANQLVAFQTPDRHGDRRRRHFEPARERGRNDRFAFRFRLCDGLEVVFLGDGDLQALPILAVQPALVAIRRPAPLAISSMNVTSQLLDLIQSATVYDLAQPYYIGMPHHPVHPPYLFGLVKKHGEYVTSAGGSSASEALALGGHVGTHIDALCHFSRAGKLHDGGEVAQSYTGGLERLSVDTIAP